MIKNQIYCRAIIPASKAPDGETPTMVFLTEEANLFGIWLSSFETGTLLIDIDEGRNTAIELAVSYIQHRNAKEVLKDAARRSRLTTDIESAQKFFI